MDFITADKRLIEASLERVDQFTKNRHIGIIHSTATRIFRHRLTTPLNTHRVAPLLGSKLSTSPRFDRGLLVHPCQTGAKNGAEVHGEGIDPGCRIEHLSSRC